MNSLLKTSKNWIFSIMNSLLISSKYGIFLIICFYFLTFSLPEFVPMLINLKDLDTRGNARPLNEEFVNTLFASMAATHGYNSEFSLKVMGPYPAFDKFTEPYYKVKNGQHRIFAMKKYWSQNPVAPLEKVFPCNVYPINLTGFQMTILSANIEQDCLPDTKIQRYNNILFVLDEEVREGPNVVVGSRKGSEQVIGSLFGTKEKQNSTWADQLKKALKYPVGSSFTGNRLEPGTEDPSASGLLLETKGKLKFKYPYYYSFDNRDEPLAIIGKEIQVHTRKILNNPNSITAESYQSYYALASSLKVLSPFQVASFLKVYLGSLSNPTSSSGSSSSAKKEIRMLNQGMNAKIKAIKLFIDYFISEIPQNPTLPIRYRNEGLENVSELTTAEIFHIFMNEFDENEKATTFRILEAQPLKGQGPNIASQFSSFAGKPIVKKWRSIFVALTDNIPSVVSSWNVWQTQGYSFYNCCVFDWMAEQALQKRKYNLVLGDIPVSSYFISVSKIL